MFILIAVLLSNPFQPETRVFNESFHSYGDCLATLEQQLDFLTEAGQPASLSCHEVQLPTT